MEKDVLIIVPAYNEGKNIEKTIQDIKSNCSYDYLIINDCSTDNTKEICEKNHFNVVSLPVNYGLTNGIQLGMKYAYKNGYKIVVQFDGDGQHEGKYIETLVQEIKKGNCDIAIGSRFVEQKKEKTMRMIGSKIISIAIKLTTGKKIKDPTSGMRAYGEKAIYEFNVNENLTPEPDTLVYMLRKKLEVKEFQVTMKEREFGKSYLTLKKSVEYMLDILFSIIFISTKHDNKKGEK